MGFRVITLLVLTSLGLACSHVEPRVGPQIVYQDVPVEKSELRINQSPAHPPAAPLSAVMHPFELLMEVDHPEIVSRQVSTAIWQEWVRSDIFPSLEFIDPFPNVLPQSPSPEIPAPDLVIRGTVPYLSVSGSEGRTSFALHVEIFDAKSGNLLWSMDHSGSVTGQFDRDFILVRQKARMPFDPAQTVLTTLARDMARPLKSWNRNLPLEHPEERTMSKTLKTWYGSASEKTRSLF